MGSTLVREARQCRYVALPRESLRSVHLHRINIAVGLRKILCELASQTNTCICQDASHIGMNDEKFGYAISQGVCLDQFLIVVNGRTDPEAANQAQTSPMGTLVHFRELA